MVCDQQVQVLLHEENKQAYSNFRSTHFLNHINFLFRNAELLEPHIAFIKG